MPVVVVVLQISSLLFYHCNTFHRQNDWADPVQEPLAEGMDMESSPIWLLSPAPLQPALRALWPRRGLFAWQCLLAVRAARSLPALP